MSSSALRTNHLNIVLFTFALRVTSDARRLVLPILTFVEVGRETDVFIVSATVISDTLNFYVHLISKINFTCQTFTLSQNDLMKIALTFLLKRINPKCW